MPREWIERIFVRLSTIYGGQFSKLWDGVDPDAVKLTWSEGLAGVTGDEIGRALQTCLKREWPPTLPEFRKLCHPPPDYQRMFINACGSCYPDALTYWAAQQFGHFELRNSSWRAAEKRWQTIVDELIEDQPLPPIPEHVGAKAIPAPGKTRNPAVAAEHIAAIKQMKPGEPSKEWAKRIMADPVRYPSISREFARQALEGEA